MCELFGLSSSQALQPRELLSHFGTHGGGVADNPDGWGLAWIEDESFHVEKEAQAAVSSNRFRELSARIRTPLVLGHVRKANPPTALVAANTHPFRHICCGREWVFAHNGVIPYDALSAAGDATPMCVPSGDTDSEHVFCIVLERIAAAFSAPQAMKDGWWLDALANVVETLSSRGRLNFLMSDGLHLIAYGHDRLCSLAHPSPACCDGRASQIAVIASEPLTDEPWSHFNPGELRVYRAGSEVARLITRKRSQPLERRPDDTDLLSVGLEERPNCASCPGVMRHNYEAETPEE